MKNRTRQLDRHAEFIEQPAKFIKFYKKTMLAATDFLMDSNFQQRGLVDSIQQAFEHILAQLHALQ